jgi:hypothetical protein
MLVSNSWHQKKLQESKYRDPEWLHTKNIGFNPIKLW